MMILFESRTLCMSKTMDKWVLLFMGAGIIVLLFVVVKEGKNKQNERATHHVFL